MNDTQDDNTLAADILLLLDHGYVVTHSGDDYSPVILFAKEAGFNERYSDVFDIGQVRKNRDIQPDVFEAMQRINNALQNAIERRNS